MNHVELLEGGDDFERIVRVEPSYFSITAEFPDLQSSDFGRLVTNWVEMSKARTQVINSESVSLPDNAEVVQVERDVIGGDVMPPIFGLVAEGTFILTLAFHLGPSASLASRVLGKVREKMLARDVVLADVDRRTREERRVAVMLIVVSVMMH